eukprot:GHVU01231992.1.p1 GENE.GHVU01231992.1~~GHVU01231992.1.p1  ORF type:complete len:356 (+),score=71.65 GHVU01231992.1:98-1165(+)
MGKARKMDQQTVPGPAHHANEMATYVPATRAYDNSKWLHSRAARHIRIMCEMQETQTRLHEEGVMCTIVFFGSARGMSEERWIEQEKILKGNLNEAQDDDGKEKAAHALKTHQKLRWMAAYFEKGRQLAYKITEWAQTEEARRHLAKILKTIPSPVTLEGYDTADEQLILDPSKPSPLVICSGGGPGLMECANKGAREVPGGRTMGMGVSLPFEPGVNAYVNETLAFRFHYFFTRKFWMLYCCLGLVALPGGLGTMDELFEVLTLKQTNKFRRDIPIVLFGVDYWKSVINLDKCVELGTCAEQDKNTLFYTDDPEEAFQHILSYLKSDRVIVPSHKSILRAKSNLTAMSPATTTS